MEIAWIKARRRLLASGVSTVGVVAIGSVAAPSAELALLVAIFSVSVYTLFTWRLLNSVAAARDSGADLPSPAPQPNERWQDFDSDRADHGQHQLLIDAVRDYAILTLDTEGRVTSWNVGAERIKGYRREEILGQHFSCFYPEEGQREGRPQRELAIASTKGRFEEEGWRVRKDGSRFWANVIVNAVRDDAGKLRGFSKITRDISERKAAADQIRQLNKDLEQQVVRLAAANHELEQKNRENEMFVYSVSHDLRSPLVNLQGFSNELGVACQDLREIIERGELPPDVQARGLALIDGDIGESIHFMQSAVRRLSNIIDALLQLSRVGRINYSRQEVDVHEIVRRVVESLAATIAEKDARVTVRDLPPAAGDPTAIEQVFANLVGNALKYLDPDRSGVIEIGYCSKTIEGQETESGAYFVRDNGLGIAEEYQTKIFQPFQRVHTSAAPGEGMGLAFVGRIVERHGGRVWVESAPGEGATFFLKLPTVASAETTNQRTGQSSAIDERSRENGCRTTSDCVSGR